MTISDPALSIDPVAVSLKEDSRLQELLRRNLRGCLLHIGYRSLKRGSDERPNWLLPMGGTNCHYGANKGKND
jgi:hypothetical protein